MQDANLMYFCAPSVLTDLGKEITFLETQIVLYDCVLYFSSKSIYSRSDGHDIY